MTGGEVFEDLLDGARAMGGRVGSHALVNYKSHLFLGVGQLSTLQTP